MATKETRGAKSEILVHIDGKFKTLRELSVEHGLLYITLSKRYHAGLRGLDLIKPVADKLVRAKKFREYEKLLMQNRSR
jgi:hypothetical protein